MVKPHHKFRASCQLVNWGVLSFIEPIREGVRKINSCAILRCNIFKGLSKLVFLIWATCQLVKRCVSSFIEPIRKYVGKINQFWDATFENGFIKIGLTHQSHLPIGQKVGFIIYWTNQKGCHKSQLTLRCNTFKTLSTLVQICENHYSKRHVPLLLSKSERVLRCIIFICKLCLTLWEAPANKPIGQKHVPWLFEPIRKLARKIISCASKQVWDSSF